MIEKSGHLPRLFLLLTLVLLGAGPALSCLPVPPRFESEELNRLHLWPANHAGRTVILHGAAAGPLEPPSGGALGSYRLEDGQGRSVRVLTRNMPREGRRYRVAVLVGQDPVNALLPLVLELGRTRPLLHPAIILGLLALVLLSLVPTVQRLTRLGRASADTPGWGDTPGNGPVIRPGVPYALELLVVGGKETGRRHIFRQDRILVGRPGLRENDLPLDDDTVSRKQALIIRDDRLGGYKIVNEGRTNPLKVNNRPCDAISLRHGDIVTVGLTRLRVEYCEADGHPGDGAARVLLLLLLLALPILTGMTWATPGNGSGEAVSVDRVDLRQLPRVDCRFRVVEVDGQTRLGLGLADFRLLLDGRPLEGATVSSRVAPGATLPRLVLVIETTPGARGRGLFLLKTAITRFLQRWPAEGQLALVTHGQGVRVAQRFTADRRALLAALDALQLGPSAPGGYYEGLELAAGLFGDGAGGRGAVIYFCGPGPFQRADMAVDSPKGLRGHPGLPIHPVLLPERDGGRTEDHLQRLALKLTEGLDGHYTLEYRSPGGEDKRVHSLRIERMPQAGGVEGGGNGCRYRALAGSGLESDGLLAAAHRQRLLRALAGLLAGLVSGGLAFRWLLRRPDPRGREVMVRRAVNLARAHFLVAGVLAGLLVSQLIGGMW